MIIKLIRAYKYNAAVLSFTKKLVRQHFVERRFLVERSSIEYLNSGDSLRYTEFFRKNDIPVEVAAIHYFDFGITQLKRILQMSSQDDIVKLVEEMEQGLDRMIISLIGKISVDNGALVDPLAAFHLRVEHKSARQAEGT